MKMIEINIIHNVAHEQYWKMLIVFYFFFTGVSAGACHYSSVYALIGYKKFAPIGKWAALISLIGFLVTPLLLIFDLEQSARFFYFMFLFNPKSAFFYGTILLAAYPMALAAYSWYLFHEKRWKSSERFKKIGPVISTVVLPLAVTVHAYTGFVFGVVKARGFWFTSVMPMYFLMGALVSGFAAVLLFAIAKQKWDNRTIGRSDMTDEVIQISRKIVAWLVCIYPAFIIPLIIMDLYGPYEAYAGGMLAIHESMFVIGDLLIGIILPLAILTHPRTRSNYFWISVACIMAIIGVFAGRYTIVYTGQLVPLS
ncbi:MAG: Polysulfide reductase, NrfD [Candidatus Syntrophoarchaeum caldarius]|uniref:Polysulfide reductase, NrfD n=1 Tax=Candidatus Syntropharchaeum caldarium TaxID=1838285 RepID=A0A1F2P8H9_9EURY|nr:MAG: Polysulfide reductase, NrfD [Candidatus Syntrophoarchaeum caldarius]